MNLRSIIYATAIATMTFAGSALASNDDYKVATVGATETKMLTTALADDANYDTSENKRICFTTIDKLKQKPTDNNTATKYKFYVKGCAIDSAKTGAGQCASGACATPTPYKVKLIAQTASGVVKVDDIDRDEDGSADSDDSDMSDSSDSDDTSKATTTTTKPAVGSATNSTSSAAASPSTSTSTGSSTGAATVTATATPTSTTSSPSTKKNSTSPSPTSAASSSAFAATVVACVAMAVTVAL